MSINETDMKMKQVLFEEAVKVFTPIKKQKYVKQSNNTGSFWYDKQCWQSRKGYHKARHKYNICKTDDKRKDMIEKSKYYKTELQRVKWDWLIG